MEWLIEVALEYPRRFAVGCVVLVLVVAGFVWWQAVWQDPHRVFDDMLANNLAATGVTKTVQTSNGSSGVTQQIRLRLGSTNAADWLVTAHSSGTSVTTEEIATPGAGYVRYLDVATSKANKIKASGVLNRWAKGDDKADTYLEQRYAESLLDIVEAPLPPIGNLPSVEREKLLEFIRDNKVFTPDYSKVTSGTVGGQSAYTYRVSVDLVMYVSLMKTFAGDLGLNQLDGTDPNQYIGQPAVVISLSVGRTSHQLLRATLGTNSYTQTYGDWGLLTDIVPPTQTISTTDLQRRLQAATAR